MSVHFLLDGYNILHQMPLSKPLTNADERAGLVRFIESARPQGSLRNPVTVIFDGYPPAESSLTSSSVKILFSRGSSADEMITRLVSEDAHPKAMIVVTDDRSIQQAVRALGAKTCPVAQFLRTGQRPEKARRSPAGKRRTADTGKAISHSLEFEITEEFADIWLRKKSS